MLRAMLSYLIVLIKKVYLFVRKSRGDNLMRRHLNEKQDNTTKSSVMEQMLGMQ